MFTFRRLSPVVAVFSFLVLAQSALAGSCVTGFHSGDAAALGAGDDVAVVELASLSCQDLSRTKLGLKAASYVFNLTGLGLACTQVGVPVSVGMFTAGFVLYTADLIVESLPCEDDAGPKTEKLVREEVCRTLTAQGIACNPNSLQRQVR